MVLLLVDRLQVRDHLRKGRRQLPHNLADLGLIELALPITGALANSGDGPLPEAVRSFSRSPDRAPVKVAYSKTHQLAPQ